MSLTSQAKKGVFWTFLQQFSVQGINFVVQIVLARLLLPSDFGLIAMIAIFVAIGQSLSDSGMTSSLIRNKVNTEADYGTVFITNFVISLVIYIVVFFAAPWVALFYKQVILTDLLRSYALIFIISSFYVVQIARFSINLDFKSQFTYQLPSVVIGATVAIIMAKKGFGVWSLVGLNIVQAISFSFVLWLFYKWRPKMIFDKKVFSFHFHYGYKLTVSGIINTIYLNLYKIIIGKSYSPAAVGYFTQADNLRLFPVNQLNAILIKVTFPIFSSIQDDTARLREVYKSSVRLVLSISTGMMLILVLISKPLLLLLLGEKWLPSVNFFQILCIASIFVPFSVYNLSILKVKGRTDLFLRAEIIKKVIGITTLVVCIRFGIEAIVWGLCITNIIGAYINAFYSGKFIDYKFLDQIFDTLKIICVGFIPFVICFFIKSHVSNVHNFVLITLMAFIFIVLYLPLIYFFNKELSHDIRKILKIK